MERSELKPEKESAAEAEKSRKIKIAERERIAKRLAIAGYCVNILLVGVVRCPGDCKSHWFERLEGPK